MVAVDDGFGHWLAGFLDGEGCFSIKTQSRGYACDLILWVRADDKSIIDEIVTRTGIGSVVFRNHRPATPNQEYAAHPLVGWSVRRKPDCIALVSLIDRYPLRAKKARDYAVWREAVMLWAEKPYGRGRSGPSDWSEMSVLKQHIEDVRRYLVVM